MMRYIAEKLIRFYQIVIRSVVPSSCVFYAHGKQGCSEYMITSMRKRGFFIGVLFGTYRILRCHPWQKDFRDPEDKS